MLDHESSLARRFGDIRPGQILVAIEPAAIPVTIVQTDVLAQQRKPFALLDEFVLRFTAAGLSTVSEISGVCGVDPALIENTVAALTTNGTLSYSGSTGTFALTSLGRTAVQDLEAITPLETTLPVTFDRLRWQLASYRSSELLTRRQATDAGMVILPAALTTRISKEEVTAPAINELLRIGAVQARSLEVLAVRKVHPDVHRFLPCELLIFSTSDSTELDIAIVVDDELSEDHSSALASLGGPTRLELRVAPTNDRPRLSSELESLRTTGAMDEPLTTQAVETAPVRSIAVFEHRQQLESALSNTKERLLIVSPWVRSAVVNDQFVGQLESLLKAGVRIHIGHGYGKDDRGSDKAALERLSRLSARYSKSFTVVRLPNTHAKILISDQLWISTSFNWLSFRGDPERTYRMEEGTLVRLPDQVDKEYERYVQFLTEPGAD